MLFSIWALWILTACGLSSDTFSGAEVPGWTTHSSDQARSLVSEIEHSKPVFVLVTSPTCLACKHLEVVLQSPAVSGWLEQHAERVLTDPNDAARAMDVFDIQGFPALLRFEKGQETARLLGTREQKRVLAWLEAPESTQPDVPLTAPIGEVHDRAIDALLDGNLAEAGRYLVTVWTRSASEPDLSLTLKWLRRDRYASMIQRVAQDASARARFEPLLAALPKEGPDLDEQPGLIADWLVLARALGEEGRITSWIERHLETPQGIEMLREHPAVFDHLISLDRVTEAGQVLGPAIWNHWVARSLGRPTGNPVTDAAPARIAERERGIAAQKLELILNCLRASGREEDALSLEKLLPK